MRAALLEQVSLRLSLCPDDEKFQEQLGRLLVPVLCSLSSPDAAVKAKTVEILEFVSSVGASRNLQWLCALCTDICVVYVRRLRCGAPLAGCLFAGQSIHKLVMIAWVCGAGPVCDCVIV